MSVETISAGDRILAIILRSDFCEPGLHFFTPGDFSQQLAYMRHAAGKVIQPHVHNAVPRSVIYTQEVLLVKSGKVRVDFYGEDQAYLQSKILGTGDVILLASAGHGFEMLEETEMIEVKQGPYMEHGDKVKFTGISSEQAFVKEDED